METKIKTNILTLNSIEISELAEIRHSRVFRLIAKLEADWVKKTNRKFHKSSYKNKFGIRFPMFELTLDECKYITNNLSLIAEERIVTRLENKADKGIDLSDPAVINKIVHDWTEERSKRIVAENKLKQYASKAELMNRVLDVYAEVDIELAYEALVFKN